MCVAQAVHELLLSGSFATSSQQHATDVTQPATPHVIQPLQLQLPVSGLCYQRIKARCSGFAELLQMNHQLAAAAAVSSSTAQGAPSDSMDVDTAAAVAVEGWGSIATDSSIAGQLLFRLDGLLAEALGSEQLAELLKQHAAAYRHDLLLLALAEGGFCSSSSSTGVPAQLLLQLLSSQQAAELGACSTPCCGSC